LSFSSRVFEPVSLYNSNSDFGDYRLLFAVINRFTKAELGSANYVTLHNSSSFYRTSQVDWLQYSSLIWWAKMAKMLDSTVFDRIKYVLVHLYGKGYTWSNSWSNSMIIVRLFIIVIVLFKSFSKVCLSSDEFVSLFSTFSHKLKCDPNFIFISN